MLTNQTTNDIVDLRSTHEEADTLLILYATEVHKLGINIHIYASDTDVMVLALTSIPELGDRTTLIMGAGPHRRHVYLLPILHALGRSRVKALRGFHAISGYDTTGRIFGKSKLAWRNAFINANDRMLNALAELGIGEKPSEEVLRGCEEFICSLLNSKNSMYTEAKERRWHYFRRLKPNQGVEKLPPTQGAMQEHIRRAHFAEQRLATCP